MERFLFVFRSDSDAHYKMRSEAMQQNHQRWQAWLREGVQKGWLVDVGDGLKEEGRVVNAKKVVIDGPFVARERLSNAVGHVISRSKSSALAAYGLSVVLAFTLLACHVDSTAPESEPQPVPRPQLVKPEFRILAEDVVTIDRGSSITLEVEFKDSTGSLVPRQPEAYSWMSTNPEVVSVAAGGVLNTGPGLGRARVTVRAPSGERDSVLVWVQPPKDALSEFRITFLYADDVPQEWRIALESAAARWQKVIRGVLPEVQLNTSEGDWPTPPDEPPIPPLTGVERGVRIYVGLSGHFPPGTYVEAVGGPFLQRPLPYPTTILGGITLNRDHPVTTISPQRLRYLTVHELGHALGLVGVVQGFPPDWFDFKTGRYTGELALEGYRLEFQSRQSHIFVNNGSHWAFPGDVMSWTGWGQHLITFVSVGALMDLGYPAAWYGAGEY